jgi:tetratricopeptide (TPR) repeat protein
MPHPAISWQQTMGTAQDQLLTPLQAAHHLGITPELLATYTRQKFKKGTQSGRYLKAMNIGGRTRYSRAELDDFDAYLQLPWPTPDGQRAPIPDGVVNHLRAESFNQCARCGEGSGVESAHIRPWAETRSNHHHNLIRICSTCHNEHDVTNVLAPEALAQLKQELIERTRAALARMMDPHAALARHRPPRPAQSYFGRIEELDELTEELRAGSSVTILGPGGIGKTELLLQALDRAETGRPVIWLDVERYSSAELVLQALTAALSTADQPCTPDTAPLILDEMRACVVFDGIEQGRPEGLDGLEDAIAALYRATYTTQFVSTSQVTLGRMPTSRRIWLGPLDRRSSLDLLTSASDVRLVGGNSVSELLEICDGHALTIRIASALTSHFGSPSSILQMIRRHGASVLALPGRRQHDRSTSLEVCLLLAYEALSRSERDVLWLLANAPAGLFDYHLEEDGPFKIPDSPSALAGLRRWNLVQRSDDAERPRAQVLSPIRIFARDRLMNDDPTRREELLRGLLVGIGLTVAAIEDRSKDPELTDYMLARYSEEMPNIRWLLTETTKRLAEPPMVRLSLGASSALMRYFFILNLADEGAAVMRQAAELAMASGLVRSAAGFTVQMIGLALRGGSAESRVSAKRMLAIVEALKDLPPEAEGDLVLSRAMLALEEGDARAAEELAMGAFGRFRQALRDAKAPTKAQEPEGGDPAPTLDELHNNLAGALRITADALLAQRKHEDAARAYRHSLKHQRGASVAVNIGQIYHQLGNCEGNIGNHLDAVRCYARAARIFHAIEMRQFRSNAIGELGFALVDCSEVADHGISDDVQRGAFEDLELELAGCFDAERPLDPARCVEVLRKLFGSMYFATLVSRTSMLPQWSLRLANELLLPLAAQSDDGRRNMYASFLLVQLELALKAGYLAGLAERARQGGSGEQDDFLGELLELCGTAHSWAHEAMRLLDWLAAYLSRQWGFRGPTASRLREWADNLRDGYDDTIELMR